MFDTVIKTVKLSDLANDEMLLVGENLVISKEDFLKEKNEYDGENVWTTKEHYARIDARHMLEDAIELEGQEMYEDWDSDIWNDITKDDIRDLQLILNRIFNRSSNVSYIADNKVEIDL